MQTHADHPKQHQPAQSLGPANLSKVSSAMIDLAADSLHLNRSKRMKSYISLNQMCGNLIWMDQQHRKICVCQTFHAIQLAYTSRLSAFCQAMVLRTLIAIARFLIWFERRASFLGPVLFEFRSTLLDYALSMILRSQRLSDERACYQKHARRCVDFKVGI